MTSFIDASFPRFGNPTTQSVRDNFEIAHDEISDLQDKTRDAPFLPLQGGIMEGPLILSRDPFSNLEAATKQYVDELAFSSGGGGGFSDAPRNGMHYARGGAIPPANNDWSDTPLFTSLEIGNSPAAKRMGLWITTTHNYFDINTESITRMSYNRTDNILDFLIRNDSVFNMSETDIVAKKPVTLPRDPETDLQAATKQYVDLHGGVPIGCMMDWPVAKLPRLWLPCNGQAVSRTTYALLYEVLGDQFGAGDGTTTFNLPDTRGRSTIGLDESDGISISARVTLSGSGINATVVGATGGSEWLMSHSHPQTVHGHGFYDPGHWHGVAGTWHSHGFPDPGHQHISGAHNHPMHDPGHGHGIGDPGHSHSLPISSVAVVVGNAEIYLMQHTALNLASGAAGTGIWTGGSGTGVLTSGGGEVWTDIRGTGRWIDANYAGSNVDAAGTGCAVEPQIANILNAGQGLSQNMPPVLVVRKIIYAGVE